MAHNISAIAHWALKVADLERTLDFYCDKLGFPEMLRLTLDNGQLLVYLRITDTQFVEIFPNGKGLEAPDEATTAVNHICLQVPDIDVMIDHLNARNIPIFRPKKLGLDGNLQCWVRDPDGNRIEFMQMLPGNLQEKAIARLSSG
jgi:lactoylglutathione lyase